MSSRVWCISALVAALVPCVSPAGAQVTGILTGVVTHAATGNPIAGATVRIDAAQRAQVTESDGRFRIASPPGSTTVRVTAIGFAPFARVVEIVGGQSTTIEVTLQANPTLLDAVVAVGTRRQDRTLAESPVPVDVIAGNLMENTGLIETPGQLQRVVPSVNTPRLPIGDNGFRPVTLRGLAPHHVLVLVNGKRRHQAAAILAGPSVPFASFTDLNAIPTSAVDHIEILRDGAAAQYGSDAIGGVVNVLLKSGWRREAQVTVGQTHTHEGDRTFTDGRFVDATAALGVAATSGAFLTVSGEVRQRGLSNRAYPDARPQWFPGDPRNDAPPVVSSHHGDGTMRDALTFLSAEFPVSRFAEAYTFGGLAVRSDLIPDAFFRRPLDVRTVRSVHPDGFRPDILQSIRDVSTVAGMRGTVGAWRWDLSSGWGSNRVAYTVRNSNNVSLGAESPTTFYAGRIATQQWTNSADAAIDLTFRETPLTLSGGVEHRTDFYQIRGGDPDSWRDGGVPILDGPFAGAPAPVGAQGFFGFRTADEVSARRSNVAAYLEAENRPNERLLLQVAGRTERYTDFGYTTDGKLAARLTIAHGFAVRGSAGTGFRAPALMQEYLSKTAHDLQFVGGVPTWINVRTFPVNSPEAQLMGAQPLRPERSVNLGAGVAFSRPGFPVMTVDYYDVSIRDRIAVGSNVTDTAIVRVLEEHGFGGVAGGTYFRNGLDTRTRGTDIVATHFVSLASAGEIALFGAYNTTRTRVTHVAPLPAELAGGDIVMFGRSQIGVLEHGQPHNTITLGVNYRAGQLGLNVDSRNSGPTALLWDDPASGDQTQPARWITNLNMSYQFSRRMRVAVSVANLFDVYPSEWRDFRDGLAAQGASMQGIFRYHGISTFGSSGRVLSLRLGYR
jgi:iron complex outermembrane recepter protein